jgi:hypothetical protein
MSNLATITNNILADSGIDDINVVVTTGSYADPAWITSLAWTKITGAPLGDYLPLTGGTLTGPLGGTSATFSGLITGQNGIFQTNAAGSIASNRFETFNGGATQMFFGFPASGSVAFNNGTDRLLITNVGEVLLGTTETGFKLNVNGTGKFSSDLTANRYRGVNSLVLNSYTTVNPSSNVYLYSPPNDRDAWIYLDSADTASNWGIYHRQIDSDVSGLPQNSIGFIGGGNNTLQAWISLLNGNGFFAGNLLVGTNSDAGFKLDVNGTGRFSNQVTITSSSSSVPLVLNNQTNNQYLLISSATGFEAMTQYYNATAGNWYTGIRTSDGLGSTSSYHIYSSTFGNDVFVLNTDGTSRFASSITATGLNLITTGSTAGLIQGAGAGSFSSLSFLNTTTGFGYDIGFGGSTTIAPNSFYIYGGSTPTVKFLINSAGAATFTGSVTATSIIRSDGTSSQFLKADGSVDSNTYVTTDTTQTITGQKTISRFASSFNGTVQSFLIDGQSTVSSGNQAALTLNSGSAGYAYQNFAQGGVSKFEIGIIGTSGDGSFYINRNIQTGETGASIFIKKSDGFVGINNINPSVQLDVNGRIYSSTQVQGGSAVMNLTSGYATFGSSSSEVGVRVGRDAALNDIIINPSGNVSIGTTTDAGFKLDVNGTGRFSGALTITSSTSSQPLVLNNQNNQQYLYINSGSGYEAMTQYYNATAGNWYTGIRTSDGLGSTSSYHIYSSTFGNDVFVLNTDGTARFVGGVGIGVSPASNLHVQAPSVSYGQFRITSTSGSNGEASINFGRTDQGLDSRWTIGQGVNGIQNSFGFYTGGASRVNLQTNGNVLIGTTTDNGNRLRVNGTIFSDSSITATSFFESSDATIKTLVEDAYQAKGIDSVVAKLYIKNGKQELGYFAQDLQGILPSAVNKGADGLLNLSYREVHTAKISALEKRITELESQLKNN